jgi:tetratricopeptide (TPR) repeat protein
MANMRLERTDAALQVLADARARYPKNPKLLSRTAVVLFNTHRPVEALAKLDEADRLEPKEPLERLDIGQVRSMVLYPYLGRYRDSAQVLAQGRAGAIEMFGDSTTAVNLAVAEASLQYWAHQDARKAIADLEALSSVRRKLLSDDYYQTLAAFFILAGDTAQAHALLRDHSKNVSAAEREALRVWEAAVTGDCARAEEIFHAALASKNLPASAEDQVRYALGRCQLSAGDYDAAIASFRAVVERKVYFVDAASMIPVAWFYLGEAYERKGDVARAAQAYETLLALWKDGDDDLYCRKEARIRLDRLAGTRSM